MTDAFTAKRYRSERLFRGLGAAALAVSVVFLVYLVVDIAIKAWPSFFESTVTLQANIDPTRVDKANVAKGDFSGLLKDAIRAEFPGVTERAEKKKVAALLSIGAADDLRYQIISHPSSIGTTITTEALLNDGADLYLKGNVGGSGAR